VAACGKQHLCQVLLRAEQQVSADMSRSWCESNRGCCFSFRRWCSVSPRRKGADLFYEVQREQGYWLVRCSKINLSPFFAFFRADIN